MLGFEQAGLPTTLREKRFPTFERNFGDGTFGFPIVPQLTLKSFPNLTAWYRADSWRGPDNQPVGQSGREWGDSSLNGRLLSRKDPDMPYWQQNIDGDKPAIFWASNPVPRYLLMPSILNLTGDFMFMCVYKQELGHDGVIVSHSGQNRQLRANRGNVNRNSYFDGTVEIISDQITAAAQTDLKMWTVRRNGTGVNNITHRVNKTAAGMGTSTATLDVNQIGGSNAIGNSFNGWMLEMAFYLDFKPDATMDVIYDYYMKQRYTLP